MRVPKQLAPVLLLLVGAAACGGLQETGQAAQERPAGVRGALDAAEACQRAINAASFMPNFADPRQARADARTRTAELDDLVEHTTDPVLRENLADVRDSVARVASGEVTLGSSGEWTAAQLDRYQQVTTRCSQLGHDGR
ncbi:hypothetical protein GCM10025787_13740 [Saccharopolyspora rosea]|uniref:Lipoprotein n=1 Tax=Saccharopolyspora rosea TaxID=524884 RepID=A0ABW3FN56_9PSEU